MAKKTKDEAPNPNSVSNRDTLQRLNFLYQASVLLSANGAPPAPPPKPIASSVKGKLRKEEMRKRNLERHLTAKVDLARTYVKSMKAIGQKTNTRMDPAVKRTLCKGCNLVLVPGSTALVRIHGHKIHGHIVHYTCTSCKTTRRIPAPPVLQPSVEEVPTAGPSTQPLANAERAQPEDVIMGGDGRLPLPVQSFYRRTKKGPQPRLPPLFQREGHVVFRGNERLPVEPS